MHYACTVRTYPNSKVHGANMEPLRGRQAPGRPHFGPMNSAIWVVVLCCGLVPKFYTYSISQNYAHGSVVLCFVVVMQSFIMNSHEVFIHIHQGCFAGTGAIVRLPQCQWSKPDGYGEISQCITTTTHSKAKTVCIFLGIYSIQGNLPGIE